MRDKCFRQKLQSEGRQIIIKLVFEKKNHFLRTHETHCHFLNKEIKHLLCSPSATL